MRVSHLSMAGLSKAFSCVIESNGVEIARISNDGLSQSVIYEFSDDTRLDQSVVFELMFEYLRNKASSGLSDETIREVVGNRLGIRT